MGTSAESGTAATDDAAFHAFFERHYAELARLAHLLTGEADAADDLAADALVAVWRHWDRVRTAAHPAAYARGVVANLARSRIRSAMRERRRVALFWSQGSERVEEPDVPAVLDLREALQRLPFRKRACVVLRHAFDLSEKDTATVLGISVGTVKSQTSRGVAELERLLAPPAEPPSGAPPTAGAGPEPAAEAGPSANRPATAPSSAPSSAPTSAEPATTRATSATTTTAATARTAPPTAPPAAPPATAAGGSVTAGVTARTGPSLSGRSGPADSGQAADGDRAGGRRTPVSGPLAESGAAAAGDIAPAHGSAPAPRPGADPAGPTRILGSASPAARARMRTGTGRGV